LDEDDLQEQEKMGVLIDFIEKCKKVMARR